jgi:glycosyltransferase involved in cell wall biosynthesis
MNTTRQPLLALNTYGTVEGDVETLLLALRGLSRTQFDLHVVSKPRGDVHRQLCTIPDLKLTTAELGGVEAALPNRSGRPTQVKDFAMGLVRLLRTIRDQKIAALYSIDRGAAPILAALAARLTRRPFILAAAYPFYGENGKISRFVLQSAAQIHGHSHYLREKLARYIPDPSRFHLAPYGLELEKYNPDLDGTRTRAEYGVGTNEPLIAMMGRLNEYKGQDDLIEASVHVLKRSPQAHVLIAGRGPDALRLRLERQIESLGVGQRVRLVGYVRSIPEFIAASNIVMMPSWEEPFGLVALEGMAMGKPVISTRAGGVPEFVVENEVGLLVPPRDPLALSQAILTLLDHPERAQTLGKNGLSRVRQHHNVSQYLARVTDVIQQGIDQGNRAA